MKSVTLHCRSRKLSGGHALPVCCAFLFGFSISRSSAWGTSGSGSNWNGQWSAGQFGRRIGRRGGPLPFSIKVKTSSHNAPRDYDNATDFYGQDVNVLTVAIRSEEPIALIKLSLPARQQCYAKGQVCTGYAFVEGHDPVMQRRIAANKEVKRPDQVTLCDLQPVSNIQSMKSDRPVLDVLKQDLVEVCTVNNKDGDYQPRAKRSLMKLQLKAESWRTKNSWLVFQIKVRNPPQTPEKLDDEGRMANTFQVILNSEGGRIFPRVIPAGKIFPVWTCGYSKWVRTSECTASCGAGVRYRIRRLLHAPPPGYPVELLINCGQSLSEMEECNPHPCDQDCELGEWTSFADGDCSVTCGTGVQVERRRVVQGPIGSGKLCPAWDAHEVRVRLRPCEMGACTIPRCELASADDMNGHLKTRCSEVCGSAGTFQTLPVAFLKEQKAAMEDCGQQWQKMPCPQRACEELNFVPYDWNKLPKLDTWTDMEMSFRFNDIAQELKVEVPENFDIGTDKSSRCILKEHNLPRLQECVVSGSPSSITFRFFNPLEGTFFTQEGGKGRKQITFKVRLWIKPPLACDKGSDDTGACIVEPSDKWDWVLKAEFTDEGKKQKESMRGSFKIYEPNIKAKSVHSSSSSSEMQIATNAGASFVHLHSSKKRLPRLAWQHPIASKASPQEQEIQDKLAQLKGHRT